MKYFKFLSKNKSEIMQFLVGLLLFLVPLIFLTSLNLAFELPKLALFRVAVLLMLLVYVVLLVKSRRIEVFSIFKKPILRRLLIFFVLVLITGSLFSIAPRLSFWGSYFRMQGLSSYLFYFLFFILLCLNFHKQEIWRAARKYLFAGFFVVLLVAVLQQVGVNLTGFDLQESSLGRIFSTFGHPNYLGSYIILLIFPLVSWAVLVKKKWPLVIVFLLALYVLALTGSRSAMFGLVVGGIFYLLLAGMMLKNKKLIVGAIALPTLAVLLVVMVNVFSQIETPGLERLVINGENSRSLQTRLVTWSSSLEMINDRVFFGHGFETFEIAHAKYADPELLKLERINSTPDRAHNTFIQLLADTGVFGLIVYLMVVFTIFKISIRSLKISDREKSFEIIGILASFTALFFANMFSFSMTVHYVILSFWLANLFFLISKESISKSLKLLDRKWIKAVLIVLVSVFVFFSIVFQNLLPVMADYYALRGLQAAEDGVADKAVSNLVLANSLNPNQSFYNYRLADVLYRSGLESEALEYLEKAGKYESYRAAFYYLLKGRIENDEEAFRKAVELAPTYPPVLLNFGLMYMERDDCDRALEKFREYLDLVPNSWELSGSDESRLFYKHNPDFDVVFSLIEECEGKNIESGNISYLSQ